MTGSIISRDSLSIRKLNIEYYTKAKKHLYNRKLPNSKGLIKAAVLWSLPSKKSPVRDQLRIRSRKMLLSARTWLKSLIRRRKKGRKRDYKDK